MRTGVRVVLASFCLMQVCAAKQKTPVLQPVAKISLAELGVRGTPTLFSLLAAREGFTLNYIDNTHVLLTFDMRKLLPRGEAGDHATRTVQAEIVDTVTGQIGLSHIFPLHDARAYLWPMGGGHFLFRDGQEFFDLDSQLETHELLHVDGRVTWVQCSEAANFAAIIVEHEQHTPEEHERLAHQSLLYNVDEPSEREEVFGFRLQPSLTQVVHSEVSKPGMIAASDEWTASQKAGIANRYRIELRPLAQVTAIGAKPETKPETTAEKAPSSEVASVASECTPILHAASTHRLLVFTCGSEGMELTAVDLHSSGDGRFEGKKLPTAALPFPPRTKTMSWGSGELLLAQTLTPWRAENESKAAQGEIRLFDTTTGKELGSAILRVVYGMARTADVSPDGKAMAVLNDGKLEIYDLTPVLPQAAK